MVTFLYGAYGTGNHGDDLILKAALQRHAGEECRVVAFEKPHLRDSISFIPNHSFIQDPERFLRRDDVVVFAGGGLFWSDEHIKIMLSIAEKARWVGCTVRAERIGVQGVHFDLEAARRFFSLCSLITVRDANSVDLLRRLDVSYLASSEPDFVLALDHQFMHRSTERPLIGINHSAVPFVHEQAHRDKTLAIYGEVARQLPDFDFAYVPHTVHFTQIDQNDLRVGELFEQHTGGRIQCLPFPAAAEDLIDIYSGLAAAIGWRYHLNVICELVGIPSAVVCQNDEHKYRGFAREQQLPIFDFDDDLDELVPDICAFLREAASAHELQFWRRVNLGSLGRQRNRLLKAHVERQFDLSRPDWDPHLRGERRQSA